MRLPQRRINTMQTGLMLAVAVVLATSACGAGGGHGRRAEHRPGRAAVLRGEYDRARAGRGNGGVRRTARSSASAASRPRTPPQCGGVPIANWDWAAVEREETRAGTTWGEFHVVGTFDGETFTVTEVGPPEPPVDSLRRVGVRQPLRAAAGGLGGHRVVGQHRGRERVRPGAARLRPFVDHVPEEADRGDRGSRARTSSMPSSPATRTATRPRSVSFGAGRYAWSPRTSRASASGAGSIPRSNATSSGMGLSIVWSDLGSGSGQVDIGVVLDRDGAAQATFDERYGPGVVVVTSALQPVQK